MNNVYFKSKESNNPAFDRADHSFCFAFLGEADFLSQREEDRDYLRWLLTDAFTGQVKIGEGYNEIA